MTNKKIINEASKILTSLQKLQSRIDNIIEKANERQWLPPHIQKVLDTLYDLSTFDLEDALLDAKDFEK